MAAHTERSPIHHLSENSFQTTIKVGSESLDILAAKDFPPDDPWSKGMRDVLISMAYKFSNKPLIEFGIGGATNPLVIINSLDKQSLPSEIVGVELDKWREELAERNLSKLSNGVPYKLHNIDAVKWLGSLNENEKLQGNAILCLPQAPLSGTENHADGYDEKNLPTGAEKWNPYGLGLNFSVLSGLSPKVENDFRAFAMFSGRVPQDKLNEMFADAGLEIAQKHDAGMAQQDPDTSVKYTIDFDTYNPEDPNSTALFYEKNEDGDYAPISAIEAEKRRAEAGKAEKDNPGTGRDILNVYHKLAVYELQPKTNPKETVIFSAN